MSIALKFINHFDVIPAIDILFYFTIFNFTFFYSIRLREKIMKEHLFIYFPYAQHRALEYNY